MYSVRRRRAIIDRKALIAELEEQVRWAAPDAPPRANLLQIFKATLYRGVGEVRRRFEDEGVRGPDVVHADAYLVDQLVRAIYDYADTYHCPVEPNERGKTDTAERVAIVATGGYGRGELFPFSDIDLMFIVPAKASSRIEQVIEFVLYMLWDLGLKVGHATRSIDDCVRLAKEDMTIRTSLLESRWLWGERSVYQAFERRFMSDVVAGSGAEFVRYKLAERDRRHERMGDSRYVLEPNIKEGKGGLRDLQTLFWIAKYLYRVKDMGDLVARGVFTTADARHFRQTQDFLWTVRCHLHYVTNRPEERLTFDVQDTIARRIGYRDRTGARGVERFMKHYFLITKAVGDLTRVLCAVLEDQHKKPRLRLRLPPFSRLWRSVEGFKMDGDRLTVDADDAFVRDPVKLLRLFEEAQRHGMDIHPQALRLVGQSLTLIDGKLRADARANESFMAILTSQNDPEKTLKRLNESGVFGRFLPDFGRVVAQMQYDMYHVYTVDEHTIRAIGILHRIESGSLAADHPTASKVVREVRSRRVLYLSVLLHDIAKGRGGDHSEIGAEIALEVGPRMGLNAWETETLSWLVLYHLLMSSTAFKRDIDDSKTVADFVELVQSPERLRLLLVLTNADIRAVGPNIWNAWKENLLGELYYSALQEMEITGGQPERRRAARVEHAKGRLRQTLDQWDAATIEGYISRGYSDYWLAYDTDAHARHFALMKEADGTEHPLRVEARPDPERGATELTVYAPDHPGLFASMAGALALSGASIVDAKIVTMANGMALDTFSIQDFAGEPFDNPERLAKLRARVQDAVSGKLHPGRALQATRDKALPSRTGVFTVAPAVFIDNQASNQHTVIEVNGRDRLGFLHDVTAALTELGLQIASAHVTTYGEHVVDVFYVKDVFGLKVEESNKLARIEQRLLEAVAPPTASGDTPAAIAAQ